MAATPFTIDVPQAVLDDLAERLGRTRWPDAVSGVGWDYGADPDYMRELVGYWRDQFDWRAQEARLNRFPQYRTVIDGIGIHVQHVPGTGPYPLPLLITHGWPSSFVEMQDLIPLLTDPASHGGDEEDAFDVVVPSIPGYGFSDRQTSPEFSYVTVADLWFKLMESLGYPRFGAHAYDIGASITGIMLRTQPERFIGYHTTEPSIPAPYLGTKTQPLTDEERKYVTYQQSWNAAEGGYMALQRTRPQSLGYGLNDSPAGLAAWIIEKWYTWTGPPTGNLDAHFTKDQLLTNITLYWATETINSANRLYRKPARIPDQLHNPGPVRPSEQIQVPTGVALTTQQIERTPRAYASRLFANILHWQELGAGGHFVALEEPELLANSIREFFRPLRRQVTAGS